VLSLESTKRFRQFSNRFPQNFKAISSYKVGNRFRNRLGKAAISSTLPAIFLFALSLEVSSLSIAYHSRDHVSLTTLTLIVHEDVDIRLPELRYAYTSM